MEIGNLAFGCSRGEYPIERDCGFEKELRRLFDAICPNGDDNGYGVEFENDVFETHLYYWGDCTCGYEEKEYEFSQTVKHSDSCYQADYAKINHAPEWDKHDKWINKYVLPIYEKHNLPTTGEEWWHGCAVVCTCDYNKKWDAWSSENQHDPKCPIVRPNFLYKPTGLSIMWYKYPLRDSYSNQELVLRKFVDVIDSCIASLAERK